MVSKSRYVDGPLTHVLVPVLVLVLVLVLVPVPVLVLVLVLELVPVLVLVLALVLVYQCIYVDGPLTHILVLIRFRRPLVV